MVTTTMTRIITKQLRDVELPGEDLEGRELLVGMIAVEVEERILTSVVRIDGTAETLEQLVCGEDVYDAVKPNVLFAVEVVFMFKAVVVGDEDEDKDKVEVRTQELSSPAERTSLVGLMLMRSLMFILLLANLLVLLKTSLQTPTKWRPFPCFLPLPGPS